MSTTVTESADAPPDEPSGPIAPGGAAGPGDGVRLTHEPALDGLRGLAVAVVVVFHLERLQGGFLGVDLFFVLSGFLITSLLVVEHAQRGAVDLGRFWVRRARRLLPALFAMVVAVSVALLVLVEEPDRARFRGDALATVGYVANWHRMAADVGYWDIFSVRSPFDHTWSLAIEEQFYLVWPLVAWLALRRGTAAGRRVLGGVALAGAGVSFVLLALLWDPLDSNRAYFGTDTRIGPTLLGAVLAVVAAGRPRRAGRPRVVHELLAVAALGWMAVNVAMVSGQGGWYYRGGLLTFALASVVVLTAVTGGAPGPLGRALSWRPLRALGAISYGVYLWHWPVIVFVTEEEVGLDGLALDAARVALTLGLSVLSYRLVERPVRRGTLSAARLRVAAVGGTAVAVAAALVATAGTPATAQPEAVDFALIPPTGSDNPTLVWPSDARLATDAPRILMVGDSGPYFLGPQLADAAEEAGLVAASSAEINCTPVNAEGRSRGVDGRIYHREPCHGFRRELWRSIVHELDPDVVVYYLANANVEAGERLDGAWRADGDPVFDAFIEETLTADAELLGEEGATVAFATSPYVGFGDGMMERVDARNATYRRVADGLPRGAVIEMGAFTTEQADAGVHMLRPDIIHLSDTGCRLVAAWMLPQLEALAEGADGGQP